MSTLDDLLDGPDEDIETAPPTEDQETTHLSADEGATGSTGRNSPGTAPGGAQVASRDEGARSNGVPPSADRPPSRTSWRSIVRWAAALMLVLIVGFALFIPTLSGLSQQRTQTHLEQQLRSALMNGIAPVNGPIAPGTPVALLEMPSIGVRQVVVEGTTPERLRDGPGHLPGTVLPGQPGVSVILGRRLAHGAPFRDLESLAVGDVVQVTTGQGEHRYQVIDATLRAGADVAAFVGEGNMLILVTGGSSLAPDDRYVVRAVLLGDPVTRGQPSSTRPVTVDDLGLEGDTSAAAPLLGWVQVLALASVAAVVLAARIGGRVAWVLAAPPIALVCVVIWEHVVLLLPGLS